MTSEGQFARFKKSINVMDPYICTLSDKAIQDCRDQLKETEDLREQSVQLMYLWLSTDPHLHAKTDYFEILRFLRACKYDIEKTKGKIKCFYHLRGSTPEWFENRDPLLPELQALLSIGVFLPLLKRDADGRLVVVIRIAAHDPRLHKQNDVFKIGNMTLDWLLSREEDTSVYGVSAVFDMQGVSLGHARQLTTSMIKKAVHSWQDCYPVRVKSLDFINSPSYVNVVLNIFRRFMKSKLKERIHIHGYNLESLHTNISKDVLPVEYGGSEGSIKELQAYWKDTVSDQAEWFKEDEKYKADILLTSV